MWLLFFIFYIEVKVDKHEAGGLGWLIRRKKGAVAIRINYKGIQMVFISCHLSGKFSGSNLIVTRINKEN